MDEVVLTESIRKRAAEICRQPLTVDQSIWSTRLLDSLGRVELAFFISDLSGVEIELEDVVAENFESVQHIVRFLKGKGG